MLIQTLAVAAALSSVSLCQLTRAEPQTGAMPPVGFSELHCSGDGVTDDTPCLQAAVNAAKNGELRVPVPAACYRITKRISIAAPIRIEANGSKLCMDIPLADDSTAGRLFDISSSQVTINGLCIDGSLGAAGALTGGARYAFFAAGTKAHHITNIHLGHNTVTHLTQSDEKRPASKKVCFGVYLQYVDDSDVTESEIDTVSGTAVHFVSTRRVSIERNKITSPGWGGIVAYGGNHEFDIGFNRVTGSVASPTMRILAAQNGDPTSLTFETPHGLKSGDKIVIYGGREKWQQLNFTSSSPNVQVTVLDSTNITVPVDSTAFGPVAGRLHAIPTSATTRYWAGSYDVPSNEAVTDGPNEDASIHDNYASGFHMYGAVYRVGSVKHLVINNNVAEHIESGTGQVTMVAVSARCAELDCSTRGLRDITIENNRFVAADRYQMCIYIMNKIPHNGTDLPAATGITIDDNKCVSSQDRHWCFANAIVVNGKDGGIRNAHVRGNQVQGDDTLPGAIVGGVISIIADAGASASSISVVNNSVSVCPEASSTAHSIGIEAGPYSTETTIDNNTISGFETAIAVDRRAVRASIGRNRYSNVRREIKR